MTSTAKKGNLIEAGNLFSQVKVTADHPFNYSGGGGGGDGMDQIIRRIDRLETNVDNLKDNINDLKISAARIETALPYLAKQEDLIELKVKLDSALPYLAKQDDLIKLNARFETELPHIATKAEVTNSRNIIIIWLIAIILGGNLLTLYAPTIGDFLKTNQQKISQKYSIGNANSQHKPSQD